METTSRAPTRPKGEVTRGYRSALRDEHARLTRRAIVEAAARLFVAQGYAPTTIDAISREAGVSRKTVFAAVGGKPQLLKYAWEWSLVGDAEPVPMLERPAVTKIQAQTDPARALHLWVAMVLDVAGRAAPIGQVLVVAADGDEEAAAMLAESEEQRLLGARAFIGHLASIGGVQAGMTADRAADLCWAYMDPMLYRRLVLQRGWSVTSYGRWLESSLTAAILPGRPHPTTSS
jgi:AcrR family transcriptional regulator